MLFVLVDFRYGRATPDLQLAHSLSCRYWLYASQLRPTNGEDQVDARFGARTRLRGEGSSVRLVDAFFFPAVRLRECPARWTPA